MTEPRIADAFAGIGGFRYGFNQAEFGECVWSCEIDDYARSVYRKQFGEVGSRDIRQLSGDEPPEFDILCGGFPCQDFSLAGKREGFEGTRGTLFHELCRLARVQKPSWLLFENVKGLLSAQNRKAFRVVLESLDDIGYNVSWQVLNSKNFGVPQNRPRVFIVGHLRAEGGSPEKILPVTGNGKEIEKEDEEGQLKTPSVRDDGTFTALDSHYYKGHGRRGNQMRALAVEEGTKIKTEINVGFQKSVYNPDGISPAVREGHGDVVRILDDFNGNIKEDDIVPAVRPTNSVEATRNASKVIEKVGNIFPSGHGAGDVLDPEGISKTLKCEGPRASSKIMPPKIIDDCYMDEVREYSDYTPSVTAHDTGGWEDIKVMENNNELLDLTENEKQGQRVYDPDGVSKTLSPNSGGWGAKTGLYLELDDDVKEKIDYILKSDKKDKRVITENGKAPSVQARNDTHKLYEERSEGDVDNFEIRRLTPKECERLQGFPDGWTKYGIDKDGNRTEISDTQRYKMLGNAVTTNVIEFIARRFKERMNW